LIEEKKQRENSLVFVPFFAHTHIQALEKRRRSVYIYRVKRVKRENEFNLCFYFYTKQIKKQDGGGGEGKGVKK
jgi:hypothetical protein